MTKTITSCLIDLGILNASLFHPYESLDEEFNNVIKKTWRQKVLREHPDKGGNADTFRITNASFEVLRDLYQQNKVKDGTFTSYLSESAKARAEANSYDISELFQKYSKSTRVPSYEFFAAAAREDVPLYKIELALSNRSRCHACKNGKSGSFHRKLYSASNDIVPISYAVVLQESGDRIAKDEIRIGILDGIAGSYTKWHHLDCWKVPKILKDGLTDPLDEEIVLADLLNMDEILFTGLGKLCFEDRVLFVRHCLNAFGRKGAIKRRLSSNDQITTKEAKTLSTVTGLLPNVNQASGSFKILCPGEIGSAIDHRFLYGRNCVISGLFPAVGGGNHDNIGVDAVTRMIESFGGKVLTRFSKYTSFLLIGKDPNRKRIKDAKVKAIDIINLSRLQDLLQGRLTFEALKTLRELDIEYFIGSSYRPTGLIQSETTDMSMFQKDAKQSGDDSKYSRITVTLDDDSEVIDLTNFEDMDGKENEVIDLTNLDHQSSKENLCSSLYPPTIHGSEIINHSNLENQNTKKKFVIPKPGVNGAIVGALNGKRFVLTGVFPELGGGSGLNLGKDKLKDLIHSFGGRVTGSVSGKTNFVVVGKEPGASKVGAANQRNIPLVDLLSLQRVIHGSSSLERISTEPPPRITSFSSGYNNNGLLMNRAAW